MLVVSKEKNKKGVFEYHLVKMGSWDNFSDFSKYFEKEFYAQVVEAKDGIYTRDWVFESNDERFIFKHHEDIGNWFYSCSGDGASNLMERMMLDIIERFTD